ncbi:Hsp20/alpha crystallin family protein [Aneurinibacillus sp. Ricciae_BoGa-3]|uniref:Hsp20/alpha crystallin family protein n=1 Tax=Aneurinibacillus sp. Ricciae_BoGa-3 TaxID=3022697 RepID=UPI0023421009|nr:Hsp20/alpha crystallin family protein [Aneurinibacillus sp. Ricciae_BoGa-3]WCK56317.1 Hsp20/alpha crystallin family protein [Aneurinibacillus sp. Ricciae_BoGa-3]
MMSKSASNQNDKNFSNTETARIEQLENEMMIQVTLSGYHRKDIRLTISNDSLSIMGAYTSENIIKNIQLPANANIEKTRAHYRDKVLTVTIPLRGPEEMKIHIWEPRNIPIE